MVLQTKHQGSRPYRFLQEDFLRFHVITLYKSHKHNLNNLCSGPLDVVLNIKAVGLGVFIR